MTQAPKQTYEAWRITHQSSELAARSAFDTAEMLQQELLTARATISTLERDELTAITQRDDASDYIDKILDEVLGQDRHEWTSAYDRDDALADVEAKMLALKSSKCLHQIAEPAATQPAAVVPYDEWVKTLGFELDAPADGVWLVIEDTGARRAASITERVLWKELLDIRAKLSYVHLREVRQPLMEWKDGVGLMWDVHAFGKWASRVASPLNWDAHGVYLKLLQSGYAEHIDVRMVNAENAATQPAAQGMDAQRWGVVANHWKKATFKYDRKGDLQSFVVSIDLSKQGLGARTIASTFDEALTVLAAQAKQGGA